MCTWETSREYQTVGWTENSKQIVKKSSDKPIWSCCQKKLYSCDHMIPKNQEDLTFIYRNSKLIFTQS